MDEIEEIEIESESEENLEISPDESEDEEKGWYQEGDLKIVPLSKPFKSGPNLIEELRLSEPTGFLFEKYGDAYTILSSTGKIKLDSGDKEIKFERNIKKLNRYLETCNDPKLGHGCARNLCMKDAKCAHGAMSDFF